MRTRSCPAHARSSSRAATGLYSVLVPPRPDGPPCPAPAGNHPSAPSHETGGSSESVWYVPATVTFSTFLTTPGFPLLRPSTRSSGLRSPPDPSVIKEYSRRLVLRLLMVLFGRVSPKTASSSVKGRPRLLAATAALYVQARTRARTATTSLTLHL